MIKSMKSKIVLVAGLGMAVAGLVGGENKKPALFG